MGADRKRLSHAVLDPVHLKELITEECQMLRWSLCWATFRNLGEVVLITAQDSQMNGSDDAQHLVARAQCHV